MHIGTDHGLTMIEVLAALTIFSFAVLGLTIGTASLMRTNNNSHLTASAINLAQGKLEDLKAMTGTAFSGLSCPLYTSAGCSDSKAASGTTFSRSWKFTANSPVTGVNKIDVQVGWTDYTSHILTFTVSLPQ